MQTLPPISDRLFFFRTHRDENKPATTLKQEQRRLDYFVFR
ncbi:hypothetical protein NUACC26_073290 [Scytonema sp. NUACC26]